MLLHLGQWIGQQHRVREDSLSLKDGDSYTKKMLRSCLEQERKQKEATQTSDNLHLSI